MPNYCYAEVWVKGRKECVDEFERVLTADYNYTTNTFSHKPHLWRIFEVNYLDYIQTGLFVCILADRKQQCEIYPTNNEN